MISDEAAVVVQRVLLGLAVAGAVVCVGLGWALRSMGRFDYRQMEQ